MDEQNISEIEESKKIQFKLRDYQGDAIVRTDEIFSSEKYNRFSGVVLPTGGGKSFVAIQKLLSFNNPEYLNKTRNATSVRDNDGNWRGGINDAKMLYIAPTHEILNQIKLHIVKNVLFAIPDLDKKTIEEIDTIIKEEFPSLKFTGINAKKGNKELPRIDDNASASQKKSGILRQIDPKQIDALVQAAFPNLAFKCYASVKGEKADVEDKDLKNAEFIIVDEAHRLGASEWRPNFESNIKDNPNVKILGITATPERTDKEGRNMMAELAKMVYSGENLISEQYMAQEIYVDDAIKDGIVISPEISSTDATLANSKEYIEILKKFNETDDFELKKELDDVLRKMEEIIGFSPRELTKEQVQEKIDEAIAEQLSKQIRNPNGKYIAFLPANRAPKSDTKKPDSDEYFQQYIDRIRKQFKNVLDENGNPVKITFEIVTSNKSIRVFRDEDGSVIPTLDKKAERIVNSQSIKNFEDAPKETGGIRILLANDALNEGVHVDGIDGAIMYRNISSSTTYLQQCGRCISSMDPQKPLEGQPKTQIIDAAGNTFKQLSDNNKGKYSRLYDLRRIKEIAKWIKDNGGKIPDINRESSENASAEEKAAAEYEARLAISLKRLKFRYSSIKRTGSLPLEDAKMVREIIENADDLKLWDIDFPIRTAQPSEAQLTGQGFMEFTPNQENFLELYRSVSHKYKEPNAVTRVFKLLNILNILKLHNPEIKLPQGISLGINDPKTGNLLQTPDTKSLMLDEFLRDKFSPETISTMLVEMRDYNLSLLDSKDKNELLYPGEQYDIGKEMAFVRGMLWTSQEYFMSYGEKSPFAIILGKKENPMKYLTGLGLVESPKDDLEKINQLNRKMFGKWRITLDSFLDSHGRLKHNEIDFFKGLKIGLLEELEECSLNNGEKYFDGFKEGSEGYDREGYDKDGYDIYGYNRFGFDKNHIHRDTGTEFSGRGFYFDKNSRKYLNVNSGLEYDLLGYNIYGFNQEGFERPSPPYSSKINGVGTYQKPLWHMRKEDGSYDVHGYEFNVPAKDSKEPKHDAHGFVSANRNISGNPLFDSSRGKGNYFLQSGATRVPTKSQREAGLSVKTDFYIEQEKINGRSFRVDIDGFDINGYKKVKVKEEEVFIHRDTSSIYDLRGRIFDQTTLEPIEAPSVRDTKQFMQLLLSGNQDLNQICALYAGNDNDISQVKGEIAKFLDEGFKIYQMYSPNAFDEDKTANPKFDGLEVLYTKDSNSSEKRARIEQFFEICPRAREILEKQTKRDLGMLKALNEKENAYNQKKIKTLKLSEEENKKKKELEDKKSHYGFGAKDDDDDAR